MKFQILPKNGSFENFLDKGDNRPMTCTGCIYDDYEKNCTHPQAGTVAHWNNPNCKVLCKTCGGHGLIGGFVNAESGYQSDPCPECNTPEPPVHLVLELVRIVNGERARV